MTEHLTIDARRREIENLVVRIEDEFFDNPGLQLTIADAERLFGIDEVTCEGVLEALVDSRVLVRRGSRYNAAA